MIYPVPVGLRSARNWEEAYFKIAPAMLSYHPGSRVKIWYSPYKRKWMIAVYRGSENDDR